MTSQEIEKATLHPGEKYSPRERIWKILEHQEPDRVTGELGGCMSFITKQAYFRLKHYLNLPTQFFEIDYWPSDASFNPWWQPKIDEEIYKYFRSDLRPVSFKLSKPFVPKKIYSDNSFIDPFGFRRKAGGTYMEISTPAPLEHVEDLNEILSDPYWPDPEKDFSVDGVGKTARCIEDADYAACIRRGGIFEPSWMRRGFNKLLEDMYLRPKFAEAILDKVTEQQIQIYDMLLDEAGDYATLVTTLDDLGAQTTALMSPKIYRKFLKPRQKKLFDHIRNKTNAKIYYHSCGNMILFIPDLIEIGVDVLHPIQPECPDMDLAILKENHGDKIVFCGGIGSQQILPRGSVGDVYAEVRRAIKAGAPGGGYIVAPGHVIQPEVPPWNIEALYSAVIKYGKYPINL
jgi:uroporphyrinogen decarboxylase